MESCERGFTLLRAPSEKRTVRVADILDIKEAKERSRRPRSTTLDLPARSKTLLINLADVFFVPNVAYRQSGDRGPKSPRPHECRDVFYTIKKVRSSSARATRSRVESAKHVRLVNLELRPQAELVHQFRRYAPSLRPYSSSPSGTT